MAPTRVHRRLPHSFRVLLAGALAAVLVVVLPGVAAHAEPSVSDIEKQIRKVWAEAEPLIEDYNKVHEDYKKNKAKQAALEKKLEPLRIQVELAQVRVGALAATVYKNQGLNAFGAVVSSGTPDVLADQLSFLDQMARQQERQLAGVAELVDKYNQDKAPLDALVEKLAASDHDLAKKKKDIEKRLDELQALRTKAYGSTGGTGSYRPWPCPAEYQPTDGYKAAQYACKQAGDPYVWAAAGPSSFDCSGLTLAAWRQVGVYLPHNAYQQMKSIPSVSRSKLQLGDLVFYYSPVHHVAIYVGDGKVMHAPSYGDHVRMMTIDDAGPVHSFGRPKS